MALKDYTEFTFNDLQKKVFDRIANDPEMGDIYQGSVNKSLIDIFGSYSDFVLYYLGRRAQESFLDTAKLESTFLGWANNFGYSARRPISSKGRVRIVITDYEDGLLRIDPQIATRQNKFIFNFDSSVKLNFDSLPFLFWNDLKRSLTGSVSFDSTGLVLNMDNEQENPTSKVTPFVWGDPIVLEYDVIQGELFYLVKSLSELKGDSKLGELFGAQPEDDISNIRFLYYSLNDSEFSNYFGGEYDKLDPEKAQGEFDPFTEIWLNNVSENQEKPSNNGERFIINRSSIFERFRSSNFVVSDPMSLNNKLSNFCLIRNKKDKGVELSFFDRLNKSTDRFNTDSWTSKGTNGQNYVHIKYFKTRGKSGNLNGKVGQEIDQVGLKKALKIMSDVAKNVDMENIGADVKVMWVSDTSGGSGFESKDSVKKNLVGYKGYGDTIGKREDFLFYMREYENVNVWGEQDEIKKDSRKPLAKKQYAGVNCYTTVEQVYDIYSDAPNAVYGVNINTENALVTEDATDFNNPVTLLSGEGIRNFDKSLGGFQYYFFNARPDLYLDINDPYSYFSAQTNFSSNQNLNRINSDIRRKMSIGTVPAYFYPIIHYFELTGTVKVNSFKYSVEECKRRCNNAIYEYLSKNIGFNKPIYKSELAKVLNSFPEVVSFELNIVPLHRQGISFNPDNFTYFSRVSIQSIQGLTTPDRVAWVNTKVNTMLKNWLRSKQTTLGRSLNSEFADYAANETIPLNTFETYIKTGINERAYWDELGKDLINEFNNYFAYDAESSGAVNLAYLIAREINLSIKKYIQEGMMSLSGDIVKFTLNNEMAALILDREMKNPGMMPSEYQLVYSQN